MTAFIPSPPFCLVPLPALWYNKAKGGIVMRFKQLVLSILLLFACCLSAAPACASYAVPNGTTVYVTASGTKYHREGCTYLKSSTAISLRTAIARGYEPCSRCRPDIFTGRYESDWDGQSDSRSDSAPAPSKGPVPSAKGDSSAHPVHVFIVVSVILVVSLCSAPWFCIRIRRKSDD